MSFKLDNPETRTPEPVTYDTGHITNLTFNFGRTGDLAEAVCQLGWVLGVTRGRRFKVVDRGRAQIPDGDDPDAPTFADVFGRRFSAGEGDTPLEVLEEVVWKYLIARGKVPAGTREV